MCTLPRNRLAAPMDRHEWWGGQGGSSPGRQTAARCAAAEQAAGQRTPLAGSSSCHFKQWREGTGVQNQSSGSHVHGWQRAHRLG